MDEFHRSVMCEEIVKALLPSPHGVYVDATLGGGGHTAALLEAGAEKVIALDMDGEALAYAGLRMARFAERLSLHHSNFRYLDEVLDQKGIESVQGVIFDLGLSWHQVRSQQRGFSYQGDGALDMRFDAESDSPTALEIIRGEPKEKIERILREYGEESKARRIAQAIVEHRREVRTTRDLADLLRQVVGTRGFRKTAMRAFQALRIAVNDELENLRIGLETALSRLASGGRVAALAYHSLEDRIVKDRYRRAEQSQEYRRVNRKPIFASEKEVKVNPAARSARLRVLEKL
ncbi:16S rRNA (cytosine(1402)-N(4))-methyltransferase [candidate division TA06 bacterium B3_TA06]|uniref:Ribosomal RNA small subunit methyltransferase H n=1 Tax=candidate division TA06 bacterium B3_TA06 TaxID=2012487 RepID=A0A532V7L5_UNCT6|nr:MAG: 16S rRNA (cytosine(1402)-N(4))-methyltransferase [candidate division TA06 bacterium B3_TA06]